MHKGFIEADLKIISSVLTNKQIMICLHDNSIAIIITEESTSYTQMETLQYADDIYFCLSSHFFNSS